MGSLHIVIYWHRENTGPPKSNKSSTLKYSSFGPILRCQHIPKRERVATHQPEIFQVPGHPLGTPRASLPIFATRELPCVRGTSSSSSSTNSVFSLFADRCKVAEFRNQGAPIVGRNRTHLTNAAESTFSSTFARSDPSLFKVRATQIDIQYSQFSCLQLSARPWPAWLASVRCISKGHTSEGGFEHGCAC
jgi:hypothetical protein